MTLNLSKVKKVSGDDKSTTFMHPDGHKMVIAHSGISALQRKQLEKMPVHEYAEGTPDQPVSNTDDSPRYGEGLIKGLRNFFSNALDSNDSNAATPPVTSQPQAPIPQPQKPQPQPPQHHSR